MPRFSLSPVPSDDEEEEESGIKSRSLYTDDEIEEEPPHPLGFGSPSLGSTGWIGLEPPSVSTTGAAFMSPGQSRYSLDDFEFYSDDEGGEKENQSYLKEPQIQSYPPLSAYIDSSTAPTTALISYHHQSRDDNENDDMDKLSTLLMAACVVDETTTKVPKQIVLPPWSQTERNIQQRVQAERQRIQQEQLEAANVLKSLLRQVERDAEKKLKQQQKEEAEAEELLRQQRLKQQQQELAEQKAEEEQRVKDEQKRERAAAMKKQEEDKIQEAKAKEAQKTEYITKAKKYVQQLVAVRASIEPFEKSKAVSKRRLQMKKIVRGKVNTLSEDAHKIKSVAQEVSQAIAQARAEDEQIKQAQQQQQPGVTPEMSRGKRYLVDLLASNAMERVQAESLTGTRGDAFPLANMLALVASEQKELIPILAAHIYTVCPIAIPLLPKLAENASEDELMVGLGMQKDKKTGEFENFPRFLARTENILSLMANIMSSTPESHVLMNGHRGAVDWLSRFLKLLPPSPTSPLPLVTAPVLVAFLSGAGHMLANVYPDKFQAYLKYIDKEVVPRLDEGELGRPSSVRLKKVLDGGFDKFKSTLPNKALAELYHGSSPTGGGTSSSGFSSQPANIGTAPGQASSGAPSPFSSSGNNNNSVPDPFGSSAPGQSSSGGPSPFTNANTMSNDPFGQQKRPGATNAMGSAGASDPFMTQGNSNNNQNNAANNPFGAPAAPVNNAFGGSTSNSGGFGSTANPSPFTSPQNPGPGASPFGQPAPGQTNQNPSPFGQASSAQSIPNPSPFGQTTNPQSSSGAFSGPPAPAPLGNAFGAPQNAGGFGNSSGNKSGFAAFGSPSNAGGFSKGPTPFGSPPGNSGFQNNQNQNPSPFSAGGGQNNQANQSPFGGANAAFGSSNNSGFGSSNRNNAGFGGNAFGGGARSNPPPFSTPGGQQNASFGQSSNFGGQGNRNSTFGGGIASGGSKPPCKFYAQGRCRYGDNCKFSHEGPAGAGGGAGTFGGGGGRGGGGFGGGWK